MEKEIDKKNLVLKEDESIGTVQIADDVVAMIASLAATEVDGVSAMAGNITNELMSKVGVKNLTKGVKDRGSGSDHGVRLQYPHHLPGSTAEGEECHRVYDRTDLLRCKHPHCRCEHEEG